MKIKMTTSMIGPNENREAGTEIEVDADEAKRLIEKGFAEPVKKTERATKVSAKKETRG
jgi:hypothetical protein